MMIRAAVFSEGLAGPRLWSARQATQHRGIRVNELIKFALDLLRRLVPTRNTLQRMLTGFRARPAWHRNVAVLALLVVLAAEFMFLVKPLLVQRADNGVEARFFLLLPDTGPVGTVGLGARQSVAQAFAEQQLRRETAALSQLAPSAALTSTLRVEATGLVTVLIQEREERTALFGAVEASPRLGSYAQAARNSAKAALPVLPPGAVLQELAMEPHGKAPRRAGERSLALTAVVMAGTLALVFWAYAWVFNMVYDAERARRDFGPQARVLSVARYRDWEARLASANPPPELYVLAEYLLQLRRQGRHRVAFVSAQPGEGKTTLVLMAGQLLRQRLRVALHDADTRSNLGERVAALAPPAAQGLHVHRCQLAPLHAPGAELHLVDLTPLLWLQRQADLLTAVDAVVLVIDEVRWRMGTRLVAERLAFLGVQIDAVVLNKSHADQSYGYGYGYGYVYVPASQGDRDAKPAAQANQS